MNLSQIKSDDMYENVSVVRKSMMAIAENATEFGNLVYTSPDDNETITNDTLNFHFNYEQREYIFDRKEVRIIFITLYSLVFCCCFFGEYVGGFISALECVKALLSVGGN